MTAVDPIAQLTGSGGPFEIVIEDVVGHPMQVYKQRMRSLRELMAQNSARAQVDWVVQEDRRFTYGEHDRLARVLARSLGQLGVQRGDRVGVGNRREPQADFGLGSLAHVAGAAAAGARSPSSRR